MPKFELGQVVATPGALQAIRSSGQTPSPFLRRHVNGGWGEHLDGHVGGSAVVPDGPSGVGAPDRGR